MTNFPPHLHGRSICTGAHCTGHDGLVDMTAGSDTPRTDLQLALSEAVEKAHALPPESVGRQFDALVGVYVTQIIGHVAKARKPNWREE